MAIEAKRVQEIFLSAVETTDPTERSALLDRECAGDRELRERIETLLRADLDPASILQEPAILAPDSQPSEDTIGLEATPDASHSTKTQWDSAAQRDDDSLTFLAPPTMPGSLGRLGNYEIQEIIGKGGFGIVFKAFDERLHRVVAIKVLSPAYAAIGSARARFIREAKAVAAVKNEHVVGIHDVDKDAQPPYFVMEFVDGVSLQGKIDKQGSLPLKEVLRIGMQIAEGLAAAHKQGQIHRDIKPANILLENGVERVKITDFGLARAVDDASVTQSGTVAGTPMYMSPEQAEGAPIDHRSDLFSLGTVLYAMCTGHPPFRATGTMAVLKRVIEDTPRPIREINNEIPDWLCEIIAKLHAKKREDRFQSAKEVAELLGQHLADVQAGRTIERRPEDRKVPVETPTTALVNRPLSGPGSPAKRSWSGPMRWLGSSVAFAALVILSLWVIPSWLRGSGTIELQSNDARVQVIVTAQDGSSTQTLTGNGDIKLPAGFYYAEARCDAAHLIDLITITDWEFKKRAFSDGVDKEKMSIRVEKDQRVFIDVRVKTREARSEPGWVQLFNGKNLDGWKMHADEPGQWKVENGLLVGKPGSIGYLLSERGDYQHFHLRAEVKLNAGGDSGLFFRARNGPVLDSKDPKFKYKKGLPGYEAQICNDASALRTGSLMLVQASAEPPLTREDRQLVQPDQWCVLEVIADGPWLTIKVNGERTANVKTDVFSRGHIALQMWNDKTEVSFKKIEIKELPPEEPGWVQLFNGKDLSGWRTHNNEPGGWHVVGGILIGTGHGVKIGIDDERYLFTDRSDFRDFHLRVEAKINAKGNSGVHFRSGLAPRIPPGYEAQINIATDPWETGSLMVFPWKEKASILNHVKEKLIVPDKWFVLEIVAQGPRIVIKVDGKTVTDREDHQYRAGHFALQGGRLKTEIVQFKKIEIKELPPEEPGWVQLFNGKNLDGWEPSEKWQVNDGVLVGRGLAFLSTKTTYRDFHCRVRAKFNSAAEGSISFRGQANETHGEIALGNKHALGVKTGSFHFFSKAKSEWAVKQTVPLAPDDQWFDLSLIVRGKRVIAVVENQTTVNLHFDRLLEEGRISLNAYEPGTVLEFSKIEIKELPPEEPGWTQLFTGKDTSAWDMKASPLWKFEKGILSCKGGELVPIRTEFKDCRIKIEARYFGGEAYLRLGPQSIQNAKGKMRVAHQLIHLHNDVSGAKSGSITVHDGKTKHIANHLDDCTRPGEWFTLEVLYEGKHIQSWVNGTQAADFINPDPGTYILGAGMTIGAVGNNSELEIRKVEVRDLAPDERGWVQLFNGKDLEGLVPSDKTPYQAWSVKNGVLTGRSNSSLKDGIVLDTSKKYAHAFHLRLEVKTNAPAKSGAILTFAKDTLRGLQQVQLMPHPGAHPHPPGTVLFGPETKSLVKAPAGLVNPDEWYVLELISNGEHLRVRINNKDVGDAKVPGRLTPNGQFRLFAYGNAEISFRKIEIKEPLPE